MRFLDFTFSFYACQTNVSAQKKRSNQLQTKIKIMNKKILFTLVCGALMLTASAQNDNNGSSHGQGMKSQRQELTPEQRAERTANRIAGELMLDDNGAAKFKSIYTDYQKELAEVNKKYMPEKQKKQEGAKPERKERTDKDIEEGIKNQFAHRRAVLDVEEKYYTKFKSVLTPRQIERVYWSSGKGGRGFGGRGHGPRGGRAFGRPGRHGNNMQGGQVFRPQGKPGFGPQGGRGFGPQGGRGFRPGSQNGPNNPDNSTGENNK